MHYGDFECLYSREGARVVDVLQEQFGDQLQIVFRHFPLTAKHPHAQRAAEAAEAAAAQGKFWKIAELLFAYQRKLSDPYRPDTPCYWEWIRRNSNMIWQPMLTWNGSVRMCSAAHTVK
jgi:Thioredoxin